ncbi:MAG: UDP-N-acetylglucosamine pyrophosphorylase [Ruminococcaceae bacterium]|nr:UDP-N-acetylglucosamine pyrophosphorylase [Oscillospiraceae bacterium]
MLNFTKTLAENYLNKLKEPWEILPIIKDILPEIICKLPRKEYREISPQVWISTSASVADTAYIKGPAIIGHNTEVRHCAFIRGNALIGNNCVIGNSTEIKNSIIFDNVQIPHFNYVGDSLLGYKAHFGAGVITSNVKSDRSTVGNTGLKKFGAIVGDYAEIGCNTVLNPGTIIGRHSTVYPCSCVRGTVPENSIYKSRDLIVRKEG